MSIFLDKIKVIKKICEHNIKNNCYEQQEIEVLVKEIIPLVCDFEDEYTKGEINENSRECTKGYCGSIF